MYLSESNVRTRPASLGPAQLSEARAGLSKTASRYRRVLLSHSHDDKYLVEQVRKLLAGQGVILYVEYNDHKMPVVTSPEAARKIKDRIGTTNRFVMLDINKPLKSKWVPWELCIGDLTNGILNVATFLVTPDYFNYEVSEYIGVYSTIEQADGGGLAVFESGQNKGIALKAWVER